MISIIAIIVVYLILAGLAVIMHVFPRTQIWVFGIFALLGIVTITTLIIFRPFG